MLLLAPNNYLRVLPNTLTVVYDPRVIVSHRDMKDGCTEMVTRRLKHLPHMTVNPCPFPIHVSLEAQSPSLAIKNTVGSKIPLTVGFFDHLFSPRDLGGEIPPETLRDKIPQGWAGQTQPGSARLSHVRIIPLRTSGLTFTWGRPLPRDRQNRLTAKKERNIFGDSK